MLIKVTQEDINIGKKRSGCLCPVALGFKREYPFKDLKVGTHSLFIIENGVTTRYKLPSKVTDFIYKYDNGFYTQPFEFEMEDIV